MTPTGTEELAHYGIDTLLGPGTTVLDIGASTGQVALPATDLGATVVCIEPLEENVAILCAAGLTVVPAAAGPTDGWCRLVECGPTGSWTIPGEGPVPMWSLATLMARYGPVDILKVDIEGGEYPLFAAASADTLRAAKVIAVDLHQWTTPDEPHREGIGEHGPGARYELGAATRLVEHLQGTHNVVAYGPVENGGTLLATRR